MAVARRNPFFEEALNDLPLQFLRGAELGRKSARKRKPSALVVCGMGGSALAGMIAEAMVARGLFKIPVIVWKNYGLPPLLPKRSLVACISHSGNTEETLSSFDEASKRGLPILAITTGGLLAKRAKERRALLVTIPGGLPPRLATGYMLGALLGALNKDRELVRAARRKFSGVSQEGRRAARVLKGKIPLIYAPLEWRALAHIWKIALNENAKVPAFSYSFPEMNHNEMLGIAGNPPPANRHLAAIFLYDPAAHPRTRKRMQLTIPILRKARVKAIEIRLAGQSFFEKLLRGVLVAFWASYWVALERGANPEDERLIEEFKLLMKK